MKFLRNQNEKWKISIEWPIITIVVKYGKDMDPARGQFLSFSGCTFDFLSILKKFSNNWENREAFLGFI